MITSIRASSLAGDHEGQTTLPKASRRRRARSATSRRTRSTEQLSGETSGALPSSENSWTRTSTIGDSVSCGLATSISSGIGDSISTGTRHSRHHFSDATSCYGSVAESARTGQSRVSLSDSKQQLDNISNVTVANEPISFHHHHHHHHHHHRPNSEDPPRHRRRHRADSAQPSPRLTSSSPSSRCRSHSAPQRSRSRSEDRSTEMNLSFCGCGFLGMYHLGVASCLIKYGPSFLAGLDRVAGASAGALVAALLVTSPSQEKIETSTEMVLQLAKSIRRKPLGALTPGYRLDSQMALLVNRVLPPDAHVTASGKLHVSLTNVKTKRNEVLSHFASRKELIEALVASCHIPIYSGTKFPKLFGQQYCDGGLTDNLVRFKDGRTVSVSPFSGKQDIGPRDYLWKGKEAYYVSLHNQDLQLNVNNFHRLSHAFFPPKSYILNQYFELGHKDAGHFLAREGLYEIPKPVPKKPTVYESSV